MGKTIDTSKKVDTSGTEEETREIKDDVTEVEAKEELTATENATTEADMTKEVKDETTKVEEKIEVDEELTTTENAGKGDENDSENKEDVNMEDKDASETNTASEPKESTTITTKETAEEADNKVDAAT